MDTKGFPSRRLRGSSALKQLVAEQILDSIAVDCKTHFSKRLERYVLHLSGGTGKDTCREVGRNAHKVLNGELLRETSYQMVPKSQSTVTP